MRAASRKSVKGRHGGREINKGAAIALQAMKAGNCEPIRQQALVDWLVTMCGVHGEPFDAGSDRQTAYALGRRSVGLDVLDHLTVNIGILNEDTENKT